MRAFWQCKRVAARIRGGAFARVVASRRNGNRALEIWHLRFQTRWMCPRKTSKGGDQLKMGRRVPVTG